MAPPYSNPSLCPSPAHPLPPVGNGWTEVDDDDEDLLMTEEELAAYFREVEASEGFDVQTIPCSSLCCAIAPIPVQVYIRDLQKGSEEAIKDYNAKNGTSFEVVEIEKATTGGCSGARFYITFKVKPTDTPADYPTTTFQAKVIYAVGGLSVELCRIKRAS